MINIFIWPVCHINTNCLLLLYRVFIFIILIKNKKQLIFSANRVRKRISTRTKNCIVFYFVSSRMSTAYFDYYDGSKIFLFISRKIGLPIDIVSIPSIKLFIVMIWINRNIMASIVCCIMLYYLFASKIIT